MKHLLLILLLLPLGLMAQELPRHKKPAKTQDKEIYDLTRNNGTAIGYETPAELAANFEKEAQLNMWTDQDKQTKKATLPAGGVLRLGIMRQTLGAADTKFFTVVVRNEKGEEVLRKELESSVPSYLPVAGVSFYRNLALLPIQEPLKTGYTVYVIDAVLQRRHEYLVKMD